MAKYNSFSGLMLGFFGKKPGQTTTDFSNELKALSPADRQYFIDGLAKLGHEIEGQAAGVNA